MTSLHAQLNYATLGKATPQLLQSMPRNGGPEHSFSNYDSRLQWASMRGTDNPLRTTEGMANGSVRGVKPCYGNQASGVFGSRVLRGEAGLASDAYVVPQGFAKSQQKGLAYWEQKPLNVAPFPQKQFYNPRLFAKNSAPTFVRTR